MPDPTPDWAEDKPGGAAEAGRNTLGNRTEAAAGEQERWLTRGVVGIGGASCLADVGHEIPTALLPSLLTSTLGAPAAALGLIEGISDALAGAAKFGGGALADDPARRRSVAVGGYTVTAAFAALTGAAGSVWQLGVLRAGAGTKLPSSPSSSTSFTTSRPQSPPSPPAGLGTGSARAVP